MTDDNLNRLVAEKVLGLVICDQWQRDVGSAAAAMVGGIWYSRCAHKTGTCVPADNVPAYCTDPAAWGALLVWLAERGMCPMLEYDGLGTWIAYVGSNGSERANSPGRALVRATLKAWGVEVT